MTEIIFQGVLILNMRKTWHFKLPYSAETAFSLQFKEILWKVNVYTLPMEKKVPFSVFFVQSMKSRIFYFLSAAYMDRWWWITVWSQAYNLQHTQEMYLLVASSNTISFLEQPCDGSTIWYGDFSKLHQWFLWLLFLLDTSSNNLAFFGCF